VPLPGDRRATKPMYDNTQKHVDSPVVEFFARVSYFHIRPGGKVIGDDPAGMRQFGTQNLKNKFCLSRFNFDHPPAPRLFPKILRPARLLIRRLGSEGAELLIQMPSIWREYYSLPIRHVARFVSCKHLRQNSDN
jgi:hypothetical protein